MDIATAFLSLTLSAAPTPSDGARLHDSFVTLYESLQAKGGVGPEDHRVIREFRDRVAADTAAHPDDTRGLAMELQLSIWLGAEDDVSGLFERLVTQTDDIRIGLAWVRYFESREDRPRVGEIYARLARHFPDDPQVTVGWAKFFKSANYYGRSVEILEGAGLDPAEDPQAAALLAECYFAEQRYQDAVDTLEAIPEEAAGSTYRDYVGFWDEEQQLRSVEAAADDLPRAELLTSQGPIVVELFENEAPNTVANFISLAESGFYDGTTFHRVIENFMAQGGDPNTRPEGEGTPGTGSPGYRIPDEDEREGARRHFTGSLAMANSGAPNTGGSQFYLTHTALAHLNGKHTVFGRVLDGLDVARSLVVGDVLETVTVLRKRDHEYVPQTLPDVSAAAAVDLDTSLTADRPPLTPVPVVTSSPPTTAPDEGESDPQP